MPDAENPVRAEFWGDEITDLSFFDIDTQRRGEKAGEIRLSPSAEVIIEDRTALADKIENLAKGVRGKKAPQVKETLLSEADSIRSGAMLSNTDKFIPLLYDKAETLFDYLDRDTLIFTSEFNNISERGRAMDFRNEETVKSAFEDGILCRGLDKYSLTFAECVDIFTSHGIVMLEGFVHGSTTIPLRKIVSFSAKQLSVWNGSYKQLEEDLNGMLTAESCGVVLAGTDKAAKNLCDSLRNDGIPAQYADKLSEIKKNALFVLPGTLSAGFEYPLEKFFIITQGHISYVPKKKARKKISKDSREVYSLSELSQGDYVVHSVHGIGIFGGIRKIDTHGIVKDYIKIEYAKGDVLYVPVTQLDMVAKYIGPSENSRVRLNKLGSQDWQKAKSRVKASVKDIAKELIALYSARMKAKGYAFHKITNGSTILRLSLNTKKLPTSLGAVMKSRRICRKPHRWTDFCAVM